MKETELKKSILNNFAQRNQYTTWKEVLKDKQSISFEAKEFEEEVTEIKQQTISKVLEILKKNRLCSHCGTIAYGDGNCHCGKNSWKYADYEYSIKKIKELQCK